MNRLTLELLTKHGSALCALVLRVGFGGFMALNHGWGKLIAWPEKHATFADPLGVSSPVSLALAIFGELVCAAMISLGLFTRAATIPAAITMLVAAFIQHSESPLGKGEHALLFALAFTAIFFLGPGPYSLDALIAKRRST